MAARSTTKQTAGKPSKKIISVPKNMLVSAEETEDIEVTDGVPRFSTESTEKNPFDEKELCFSINDVDYYAPVRVPASWGLHFMRLRLGYGNDMAVIYALEQALGADVVTKLESIPDLKPDQLDGITLRITQKFWSSLSGPKDGSTKGSKS